MDPSASSANGDTSPESALVSAIDDLSRAALTDEQRGHGWSEYGRDRIVGYFADLLRLMRSGQPLPEVNFARLVDSVGVDPRPTDKLTSICRETVVVLHG
jgi:hypothetical protein